MTEVRTYTIEPQGKKYATICRTDGYWSITWLSKNKKQAKRKGDDFVSGKRTAMRKYVTRYGEALNTVKSQQPRRIAIAHPGTNSAALAALLVASMAANQGGHK